MPSNWHEVLLEILVQTYSSLGSHFVTKLCHIIYLWNDKKWFFPELREWETFQSEDIAHGRTSISSRLRQTFMKPLNDQEDKSENLRATSVNNKVLRGRLEWIRETLELWSVEVWCDDVSKKQNLEKNLVKRNEKDLIWIVKSWLNLINMIIQLTCWR